MTAYAYEVLPRSAGGWRLRLLEDGEEVGGGAFPVQEVRPEQGMDWWNAMSESERAHWLREAGSARPVDAYQAKLLAEAYSAAVEAADDWKGGRP